MWGQSFENDPLLRGHTTTHRLHKNILSFTYYVTYHLYNRTKKKH